MSFRMVPIGLFLSLLAVCVQSWASGSSESNTWLPSSNRIIFSVGNRDNSSNDLAHSGFSGVLNYQVDASQPILSSDFPEGMFYGSDRSLSQDMDVPQVTIQFNLKRSRRDLVFRVARAGSETSIVSLDRENTFRITSKMLGSDEGWVVGQYDLHLGSVPKGDHTLILTVDPKDGSEYVKSFGWDALVLFWR